MLRAVELAAVRGERVVFAGLGFGCGPGEALLLTGPNGERLAKRHGAPTLASLREAGEDGRALADLLRAGCLPTGFSARNA